MEEVAVSRSTGASAMGPVCRGMVSRGDFRCRFGVCWLWIQKGMESEICTITLFSPTWLARTKFVVGIVFVGQKTLGGLAAPIFFKLEALTT